MEKDIPKATEAFFLPGNQLASILTIGPQSIDWNMPLAPQSNIMKIRDVLKPNKTLIRTEVISPININILPLT